ncbi:MAG: hypothetical protein Q8868_06870 [Bacteroidota bacterium]|nr:hypothetical protein [Bacteroidota bacterium]
MISVHHACLNKALESPGNNARYYNVRGEAKFYLKDYDGALADFNKVIRYSYGDKSERAEAYFWRGMVEINMKQNDNGCLDFSKAGKMDFAKADELKELYCQ